MNLAIPERLETARLNLFRSRYEDAEEIFYAYASKPEATKYVSWPTHKTLRDTRTFLDYAARGWSAGNDYSFVIRLKRYNRLIGGCGLLHDDGKIQFGYILSPSCWGNGFATEVCRGLVSMMKTIPGIRSVSSFVDADNVASAHVLHKAGLVEEARLERWFRFVNQDNAPKDCLLFALPMGGRNSTDLK